MTNSSAYLAAFIFLYSSLSLTAAARRQVWELDLTTLGIEELNNKATAPVFAMRFSPDGSEIAVVVGWYGAKATPKSSLLVLTSRTPAKNVRHYQINAGIEDTEDGRIEGLGWTASGDAISGGGEAVQIHLKLSSLIIVGNTVSIPTAIVKS